MLGRYRVLDFSIHVVLPFGVSNCMIGTYAPITTITPFAPVYLQVKGAREVCALFALRSSATWAAVVALSVQ